MRKRKTRMLVSALVDVLSNCTWNVQINPHRHMKIVPPTFLYVLTIAWEKDSAKRRTLGSLVHWIDWYIICWYFCWSIYPPSHNRFSYPNLTLLSILFYIESLVDILWYGTSQWRCFTPYTRKSARLLRSICSSCTLGKARLYSTFYKRRQHLKVCKTCLKDIRISHLSWSVPNTVLYEILILKLETALLYQRKPVETT